VTGFACELLRASAPGAAHKEAMIRRAARDRTPRASWPNLGPAGGCLFAVTSRLPAGLT